MFSIFKTLNFITLYIIGSFNDWIDKGYRTSFLTMPTEVFRRVANKNYPLKT